MSDNLIERVDTPVALAEAYRCGKEAGDAEISELRQQLAEAQAEVLEQARIIGMGGQREIDLRQHVTLLRDALAQTRHMVYHGEPKPGWLTRIDKALAATKPKP